MNFTFTQGLSSSYLNSCELYKEFLNQGSMLRKLFLWSLGQHTSDCWFNFLELSNEEFQDQNPLQSYYSKQEKQQQQQRATAVATAKEKNTDGNIGKRLSNRASSIHQNDLFRRKRNYKSLMTVRIGKNNKQQGKRATRKIKNCPSVSTQNSFSCNTHDKKSEVRLQQHAVFLIQQKQWSLATFPTVFFMYKM